MIFSNDIHAFYATFYATVSAIIFYLLSSYLKKKNPQSLLEGCQHDIHELHKRFENADVEVEKEREKWMMDRDEFESVQNKMRIQIDELKDNLRQSTEKIEELEQKQKVQSKF